MRATDCVAEHIGNRIDSESKAKIGSDDELADDYAAFDKIADYRNIPPYD